MPCLDQPQEAEDSHVHQVERRPASPDQLNNKEDTYEGCYLVW
jgi:hypothetical protein